MPIELPLDGGSRIRYRPQAGGEIQDIRHFWDFDPALGGLYTWVIGHVVDNVFFQWPENIFGPTTPDDIIWRQKNQAPSKGAWYVSFVPRVNELLERYGDVTPDIAPSDQLNLLVENKIISGFFRMKPHPTDTQPVFEVYYRANPNDPPPKELWDYT